MTRIADNHALRYRPKDLHISALRSSLGDDTLEHLSNPLGNKRGGNGFVHPALYLLRLRLHGGAVSGNGLEIPGSARLVSGEQPLLNNVRIPPVRGCCM